MSDKLKKRIEEIQGKSKKTGKSSLLARLLNKGMISIIIFLAGLIFVSVSPKYKLAIYENVFNSNLNFMENNSKISEYLGDIIPFDNLINNTKQVFSETLEYTEENKYKDGSVLTVSENYLVPALQSGIVVYKGEKENYGNTVIIQQVNGTDLWYGNIGNININTYDYIEKGAFLGEAAGSSIYLVCEINGEYKEYEECLK